LIFNEPVGQNKTSWLPEEKRVKQPIHGALAGQRTYLVAPPPMGSTSWKRKFGFGGKEEGGLD